MENIIETHKEMVLRLAKPGEDILKSLDAKKCDLVHMGGCLMGEAAELYDALADGEVGEVIKEAGDWEFYWVKCADIFGVARVDFFKTLQTRTPQYHATELMRLGGHFWDVVKRIVIYQKDPHSPDKKFNGRTLHEVACDMLTRMEVDIDAIYLLTSLSREYVLEQNWEKLDGGGKGRYGAGYSDKAAQERKDEDNKA